MTTSTTTLPSAQASCISGLIQLSHPKGGVVDDQHDVVRPRAARVVPMDPDGAFSVDDPSQACHTWDRTRGGCAGRAWSPDRQADRKSTRLNSSHQIISYAVFCLKKK